MTVLLDDFAVACLNPLHQPLPATGIKDEILISGVLDHVTKICLCR